jgi:ribose transport system permease protein
MAAPHPSESAATKPTVPGAKFGASWAGKLIGVQGPLIGLVALCIIFSFTTSAFLSFRNVLNILDQVTVLGIIAIGMTAVIVIGGIDLSVGSVLAFSMMILGWLSHDCGLPLLLAVVAALLVGALCGWANGVLVTQSCRRSSPP